MKKPLILFYSVFWVTSLALSAHAEELTHKFVVDDFNGKSQEFSLKPNFVRENGSYRPGLFMSAVSAKPLDYDPQIEWVKKPKDESTRKFMESVTGRDLPVRIEFAGFKKEEAAKALAEAIRQSPDPLEFRFRALDKYKAYQSRSSVGGPLLRKSADDDGEMKYRELEFVVPESAVTVKNLKTGEETPLSRFVDKNYDRSWKAALKSVFEKKMTEDAKDGSVMAEGKQQKKGHNGGSADSSRAADSSTTTAK